MKIFESKLSPPETRKYLARERLFRMLDKHLPKSLISITSEGGYGKTTLLSSYVKERQIFAVWYRLEASDRDPLAFLTYLRAGLSAHPACKMALAEQEHETKDTGQLVEQITMQMRAIDERLLIVLDDYHHLKEQEEIKRIMAGWLQAAPPLVTFIINGRMKPDLPLVQLKLRQQMAELSSHDLAFDREETALFFRELFDLKMSTEEIQLIVHKTEGWAASLVLLWDALQNLDDCQRKHFITHMGITEDIYSYLVTEVLGQQPEYLQHFLLYTSLVEELDPSIINQWLDRDDAQKLIDHLQTHHLFLYKDHRGAYRYHQLFKVFLYQHLKSEMSLAELHPLHIRLAMVHEQNHQLLRAFVHYTWGKDYLEAARLMRVMVNRYRPEWFVHVVDGALEALSPDHSLATTSLFLFRCVPLEILEALIPVLEESIEQKKQTNGMIAPLQHRMANIHFYRGDLPQALTLFHSSARGAEDTQDFALVALNFSMASQIYRLQGHHDEAIRYARQSLSYSEQHVIPPHVLMHGLWNLAEGLLEQKQHDATELFITQAITVSDSCDEASKAFPYSSMGKLYRQRQDYSQAIEWGQKAVAHASRFRIDTDMGWASKELGITYLHAKQLDLAEECLRASQGYFRKYAYLHQIIGEWLQKLTRKQRAESLGEGPTSAQTEPLTIKILGEFTIHRGREPIRIVRKSSLYLFLLLLTNRGRKLTKDYIMEELFPEDGIAAAQNKFYVSLSILRKSLEPELDFGRKSAYIKQHRDSYYLAMQHVDVDADAFVQAAEVTESSLSIQTVNQLKKAEACYQGDFARDFPYQSFLATEREKLRTCYLHLLERLAAYYWDNRQLEEGMYYYDKILSEDPYSEHIYQAYATRLLEEKLIFKAQSVYEMGKQRLEEELGIPMVIDAFPTERHKAVRRNEAIVRKQ